MTTDYSVGMHTFHKWPKMEQNPSTKMTDPENIEMIHKFTLFKG